jgi:hypothetical protein
MDVWQTYRGSRTWFGRCSRLCRSFSRDKGDLCISFSAGQKIDGNEAQDEGELAEFVAGMLPGEEATHFLKEFDVKRKQPSHGAGAARGSPAPNTQIDSNETISIISAPSMDSGRRRNVDEYRDLLHLSGRFYSNRFNFKVSESNELD